MTTARGKSDDATGPTLTKTSSVTLPTPKLHKMSTKTSNKMSTEMSTTSRKLVTSLVIRFSVSMLSHLEFPTCAELLHLENNGQIRTHSL